MCCDDSGSGLTPWVYLLEKSQGEANISYNYSFILGCLMHTADLLIASRISCLHIRGGLFIIIFQSTFGASALPDTRSQ